MRGERIGEGSIGLHRLAVKGHWHRAPKSAPTNKRDGTSLEGKDALAVSHLSVLALQSGLADGGGKRPPQRRRLATAVCKRCSCGSRLESDGCEAVFPDLPTRARGVSCPPARLRVASTRGCPLRVRIPGRDAPRADWLRRSRNALESGCDGKSRGTGSFPLVRRGIGGIHRGFRFESEQSDFGLQLGMSARGIDAALGATASLRATSAGRPMMRFPKSRSARRAASGMGHDPRGPPP